MAADGKLTLWFMKTDNGRPLPAEVDMNDNPWTRVLAEGLPDIDITWLLIPEETFAEQKNIMIAAGDIPDMFPVSHKEMPKWADNGLLPPLDDLVAEHYPDQSEFFDQDTWERAFHSFASYQGQQYRLLVPQNSHRTHQVLLLRKDWLDKLGLQVPDTLDELMTVMKAFTFDDPDGNGENDTVGFTGYRELGRMNPFLNPFGVEDDRGNLHWSTVDGQIVPDFIRPEMKQALAYVRETFESGGVRQGEPGAVRGGDDRRSRPRAQDAQHHAALDLHRHHHPVPAAHRQGDAVQLRPDLRALQPERVLHR